MERKESGSSREHHLAPVKDESIIRGFVRLLHGMSVAGNEEAPSANVLSELSLSLRCDAIMIAALLLFDAAFARS